MPVATTSAMPAPCQASASWNVIGGTDQIRERTPFVSADHVRCVTTTVAVFDYDVGERAKHRALPLLSFPGTRVGSRLLHNDGPGIQKREFTRNSMAPEMFEKVDEQVADSIHKLTHATSAMVDAMDESVRILKRAVKRSGDVAEEIMDDTTQRVKRHPAETIAMTFAVGVIVGGFIGWAVARR